MAFASVTHDGCISYKPSASHQPMETECVSPTHSLTHHLKPSVSGYQAHIVM